jgi:hypothetical protein
MLLPLPSFPQFFNNQLTEDILAIEQPEIIAGSGEGFVARMGDG